MTSNMSTPNTSKLRRRPVIAAAMLASAALVAAGCSSSDDSSQADHANMSGMSHASSAPASGSSASPGAATRNDSDIRFNQMMIPHHRQAVAMADLVPSRTENPEVRALATEIKNAQQPEIDQMSARLAQWQVPVDDEGGMSGGDMGDGGMSGDMGGMDHSGMPGMMSEADMTAMRDARGADFDRLWLQGMIRHHEGAIAMADEELATGIDPQSRELATQIKAAQQREIDQMKQLLGQ